MKLVVVPKIIPLLKGRTEEERIENDKRNEHAFGLLISNLIDKKIKILHTVLLAKLIVVEVDDDQAEWLSLHPFVEWLLG